ncbi:hypothetical protein HYH03_014397 [Edaphochlamys debaryana]|uniref:Chitin-binding type-2 domain-containing protein n=1 Tax=Edaphochlamys debaryana TaxID=47281 RepID=A0A836BS91_9CHLO|nr:hypothetical protein HYH03_014397 [Edaphochlamys debaryana]|eukprot:KAG2486897.1 hypothetical protein HYH03_014397 [Edaphochlamys debaryana]
MASAREGTSSLAHAGVGVGRQLTSQSRKLADQTSIDLPDGTTLEPSESAGFTLSIPDIGIDSIAADLVVQDGAATIHVEGHASFIFNAITMDALSISLSMADGTRLRGSATGALAGYSGTLGFSFSLPSGTPAVSPPPEFSLSVSEIDVGKALRAVGPSATDLLPSFLLDLTLPSFTMASYSVQGEDDTPAVGVYSISVGPTASGIGADLVFDRSGVLVAAASMDGSLDLGSALQKILPGSALPIDISGLVIISNPVVSVVSPRAASLNVPTSAPAGTYLGFGLQIPPLLGDNTVLASMLVADGNGTKSVTVELGWTGSFTPVPYVELNGASVLFQTGTGLVVSANGNLLNTPVSASLVVADKASKDQGAPALTFTGTATDVSASNILGTLFPDTPKVVLEILDPVRFAEIDFTYNGTSFGVSASPDLSGVPGLGQILSYLGFQQDDIKIRPSLADGGSIEIAITKTWPLALGSPFVGTSNLGFGVSVAERGPNIQIEAAASFQATMALPFLDPPNVAFDLGAAVSYDSTAPPPSISFILSASATATSTPFHIKGFPWIGIGFIGGSVGLQPLPQPPFVNIRNIEFAATGVILDVDVQVAVLYDQPQALFAVQFGLQNFDLQKMLDKLSVDVDLGPFNVIVNSAFFSFADQPANFGPVSIPAGLQLGANMTFLSIPFGFNAQIDTSGFELQASARDITDAPIMQEVFREVQSVIDDLKLGFKIADEIQLHYVSIDLELKTSQQSFAFDFSATLFGVDLYLLDLTLPSFTMASYSVQKILPGSALPIDISGLVIISNPVVSVVSPRAASLNVPTSVDGLFTPVPYVELNGASVLFQTGTGLVVSANGNLLNTPVSASLVVADKASKDQGAPALTFTGTATDVSASNILGTLFPDTPKVVLEILDPVRFAEIDFTYNGTSFGVSASPDLSGVPGLGQILSYLGFQQDDIKIRPSLADGGSIEIAITKTWPLALGSPFVGTSNLGFGVSVAERGPNIQIEAAASFQATMALPFLDPPNVAFDLGAAGFPWIGIGFIGGSVGLQPLPQPPFVNIRNIEFAATGVILDVDVQVAVLYDQPQALFAVQFGLQNFDLQKMLDKLSVDVDLGPFNVIVNSAFFSFADQPANFGPVSIPAGLQLGANMTFLSIPFGFNAQIDTSGFELQASARDITDAPIMQEVFREVQSVIDDLGFKIADEIQLHYVSIDLELKTSQQSFAFDFSATLFGVDLSVNGLKLDPKSVPWNQIVDTLKDTILKPLTAACTKDTYARGSQPVNTCPSGYEQQGAICYPSCPSDWQYGSHGVLNTCYQNCPPGYRDDGVGGTGLTCSYVGCDPNTQVQDEIGGLCYDKCDAGYTYYGSRCYKGCDAGYSDKAVFTSCSTWSCNPGDEDNGAGTCYPRCRDGYHSNGLTMCIQNSCPDGYRNDPLSCFRGAVTRGKGCCCVNLKFYKNKCCGNCDSGFTDTGCTCYRGPDTKWKSTYDRGVGYPKGRTYVKSSYAAKNPRTSIHSFAKKTSTRGSKPLGCPANTDWDGGLVCYDKCKAGYKGAAFLCWQDSCPPGLIDCGTYCAPASAGSCANFVGAAWQNCRAVYPSSGRRAALASAASVIETPKQEAEAEVLVSPDAEAVAATVLALHTRRPAECDEASGAAEAKPECFCVGRAVGTYANPFDAARTSFVLCNGDGAAHVHECAAGLVFDPAVGLCDLAPEAKAQQHQPRVPDCLGKPDGSYVLRAGDRASVYKCVAGSVVTQPPCSEGQVWNGALGRCVDGPSSTETTTQQQPAPCTSADCFCADKPDGKYADVLGGDTAKYIRCLGGKGRVAACPPYTMWHHAEATCADAPRNGTVLAAACKDVECFCIGRPDGAYADPWGPSDGASSGIICAQQYATPLTCDVDFVFDAAASPPCRSKDDVGVPRRVGGGKAARV